METFLANDFTLTVNGQTSPIAREDVLAFYEASRRKATFTSLFA